MRRLFVAAYLLLLAGSVPGTAVAAAVGSVSMELGEVAADRVIVRYTIANSGSDELTVLTWDTPLEGFFGDVLDVRVDGEPVRYVGRLYKLGTPSAEQFRRLAPGETASVDINLAEHYL